MPEKTDRCRCRAMPSNSARGRNGDSGLIGGSSTTKAHGGKEYNREGREGTRREKILKRSSFASFAVKTGFPRFSFVRLCAPSWLYSMRLRTPLWLNSALPGKPAPPGRLAHSIRGRSDFRFRSAFAVLAPRRRATAPPQDSSSKDSTSARSARRMGRPSTGLRGASRRPSRGNTASSTGCSPARNRKVGNSSHSSRAKR